MKLSRYFTALIGYALLVLTSCSRPSQPKTLTLRIWQTETDPEAIKEMDIEARQFEQDHPGVKVEIESVGWSSLGSKLVIAMKTENLPDLAHLEPFMTASLFQRGLLIPIDDVIDTMQATNGPIYKGVLDLQSFNGHRYGIAYAVGTTGFAYRKDVAEKLKLHEPKTWKEYVEFVRAMKEKGNLPLTLPGGDPFFVDQLFAEMLANDGGKLFDTNYGAPRPLMNSVKFKETLQFFADLRPYTDPRWTTEPYLDQFNRFARGDVGNVPVTYARAFRSIEGAAKTGSLATGVQPTPAYFGWMPQPRGPSLPADQPTIATIDCEPYVIFKAAEQRKLGTKSSADLSKEFLENYFYQRKHYVQFVRSVPIHLTPIFQELAESSDYLDDPAIQRWKSWEEQTSDFLKSGRTRPILMPDMSEAGRSLRLLLELQNEHIITDAVTDVMRGGSVEDASQAAQTHAERLVRSVYGRN